MLHGLCKITGPESKSLLVRKPANKILEKIYEFAQPLFLLGLVSTLSSLSLSAMSNL